ncbi:transposase [Dankookia sp. GCM10030260]|uniref:transposase n=1 Tax=Dankookia sp. GCM10030260 TaxID=3273390 RepID=UPI003613749E
MRRQPRRAGSGGCPSARTARCRPPASSTARPREQRKGRAHTDPVSYDVDQRTNGRKRHVLTDTLGLPLQIVVHSAGNQDRDGVALVLEGLRKRCPDLELIWADAGYLARQVNAAVPNLRIQIVKCAKPTVWELLPRRRVHRANLLLLRPQPPLCQGLRRPCRCRQRLHSPRHDPPPPPQAGQSFIPTFEAGSESACAAGAAAGGYPSCCSPIRARL